MPKDHAHEFLKKLDEDADLRAKVRKARDLMSSRLVEIAKEHGHDVTAEELREAMHEKWDGSVAIRKKTDEEDGPATCIIPLSERPQY